MVRLIGQANKTQVKIENQKFTALIDSGAQISQLTKSLVKALGLKMKHLKELLPLDGAGGIDVPYLGYVEACLAFPEIQNFDEDCLFLVMSDHTYGDRVPVTIGTLHIDMMLDKASPAELESLSRAWDRGFVNRRIQAKQLQLENESQLNNIKGTVKLTQNVKLKPGQMKKVKSRSNHPLNGKRVNVILEPIEEEEGSYTVPSYNFVKGNSRSIYVGLRNLSCRTVTLRKGTVAAQLSPANEIPKMLAPKLKSVNHELESAKNQGPKSNEPEFVGTTDSLPDLTQEHRKKLFSKLNLTGYDDWTPEQRKATDDVIERYHHIFAVEDLELGCTDLVKHEIKLTNYVPFKERYRRIPPHQYAEVRKHLDEMLQIGAIRRSSSPWASAIVLVRKKDGALRFCIDLRKLNERTVKDAYSLPWIEDSLDSLNGSCIFTSIDLKSGYWQVELDEKSIPLTAFTVGPLGFYECVRMPFGLTNALATFQRLMESCLGELHLNWCIIYLDDVIVFSKTPEEHIERLEAVFKKISDSGLKLKPSKCEFFKKRIHYLGHIVSNEGIETDPKKIEAIVKWPGPRTVHEVHKFLGFTNYYRKFVYKYAQIARPLNKLISGENAKKKHRKVDWGEDQEISFCELKDACTKTPVLAYADYKKPFRVNTDASERGLGSVLYQKQDDGTFPVITYASRSLSKTEKNYNAHKLEFLALKWAITEHFHEYLYGGDFEVFTDNNPLTYVLTSAKLDATVQRWIAYLANYNFKIFYCCGHSNIDADSLSRIPWEVVQEDHAQTGAIVKSLLLSQNDAVRVPHLPNAVIAMHELIVRTNFQLTKAQWREEQKTDPSISKVVDLIRAKQLASYDCQKRISVILKV